MPSAPKGKVSGININLLLPQGSAQKLPVKFLKWLVSYGRFIAIVVEIIVVATFVVRFKLDADLASLKDQINHQVPFIEDKAQDEARIRQFQFKLATIKKTHAAAPDWKSVLENISQQMPSSTKLTTINLDKSSGSTLLFKVSGRSSTSNDLSVLLAGLKQAKSFRNITLTNINFDAGQIVFSISGEVVQ
jgi:Tfp pilus assembly protein PilN